MRERIPLASLTTLGVGGPCSVLVDAIDPKSLRTACTLPALEGMPFVPLGGGSNVVAADRPRPLAVIRLHDATLQVPRVEDDCVILKVGAGLRLDDLAEFSVNEGLAGIEALSGVPGTVGAAVVQNVGAYGGEMSRCVERVEALDLQNGKIRLFRREECGFAYRRSRFKGPDLGRYVVVRVELRLKRRNVASVCHDELHAALGVSEAPITEIRACILELRRRKGMLQERGLSSPRSAGCFFVNPTLSIPAFHRLRTRLGAGRDIPAHPAGKGRVKIPAAFLVEQAGFPKGFRHGGVGLSDRHALALVNFGGGSASELLELAARIQRKVEERFGVVLAPEPVFVGFEPEELPLKEALVIPYARRAVSPP